MSKTAPGTMRTRDCVHKSSECILQKPTTQSHHRMRQSATNLRQQSKLQNSNS